MKSILAVWVCVAIILGGCTASRIPAPKPGEFSSYRDFAISRSPKNRWPDVPQDLQARARACAIDAQMTYFTPNELKRMEAFVRGEGGMTGEEFNQLQRDIDRRAADQAAVVQVLERICPDTVRDLRAWGKAHPQ
jgi:hypothetical protein